MQRRYVGGEVKQCIKDGTKQETANCDVIGMHCLTGNDAWQGVMYTHNWADSGHNNAYFGVRSRDMVPEPPSENLLGVVKTTNRKLCFRLCMRVLGCSSFAVGDLNAGNVTCMLLDRELPSTVPKQGWTYYAMKS